MPTGEELSLTTFGISSNADALWHVLLRFPDLELSELCARTGADAELTTAAVDELVERGFVESAATPSGVAPVDPMIAVELAVSIEQRELADRLLQLSGLRAHLPALASTHARGRQRLDRELPIEVVDGLETTRRRILLLARSSRFETLSMDDSQTGSEGMQVAMTDDLALLNRGIVGRSIVQRDVLDSEQ